MLKYTLAILVTVAPFMRAIGTELSETNNGFFLAIDGGRSGTNEPIQFDEYLVFQPYYTLYRRNDKNLVELQYPDVEHGLKLGLTGPDGKEVPKTSVGKKIGAMWTQLRGYADSKMWFSVDAGNDYNPATGAGGGSLIYPMTTFFKMKDPGIYTLEIQMQMLRHTPSADPEEQYKNLIRFAPIKIKIEKPPSPEPGR